MKTMKNFLIALTVLGTAAVATINVALNEKTPIVSNMTLQNLEAFTNGFPSTELPSGATNVDPNKCFTRTKMGETEANLSVIVYYICSPYDVDSSCQTGWQRYNSEGLPTNDFSLCSNSCNNATYE